MSTTLLLPDSSNVPDAGARALGVIRRIAGGELTGLRIAAIGATLSGGAAAAAADDADALAVMRALIREGAIVTAFDPEADQDSVAAHPDISFADSLARAILGAHIVAVLGDWMELRLADPHIVGLLVAARRVVDCRHALDAELYRAARWEYRGLDD